MKITHLLLIGCCLCFLSPGCRKKKEEAPQPFASFLTGGIKGTFSGTVPLENDPLHDSVTIQNGKFEGKIWYVESK